MPRQLTIAALAAFAVLISGSTQAADGPELVSVKRIWDKGPHNAFADLIRFQDRWYCSFRESEGHVGGDGKLRVLVSTDGDAWESAALLAEEGIDLRDPKLSITPDGRLMIVAGGSVYQGTPDLKGMQPRVAFSPDGRTWTPTRRVLGEWEWLWRVTWHEGKAYGVSYIATNRLPAGAKPPADAEGGTLKLVVSDDGVNYRLITPLKVTGRANETTVRFLASGEMVALVRREEGNQLGWIGVSRAPYREWNWHETGHRLGGPNFIQLPDGSLWAGSRSYAPGGAKTVLARMTPNSYQPVLTFPSGGDTSYPGMVWHENLLWMSYYSSHEGRTSIYLAKVKLPH
jgi:hypothetical protein